MPSTICSTTRAKPRYMHFVNLLSKSITFLLAPLLWLGYYFDLLDWVIPLLLLAFLTAQWLQGKQQDRASPLQGYLLKFLFGLGALLCALSAAFKSLDLLLYYPVAVNAVFFAAFAVSLRAPQSIVELIAQRAGTTITPAVKSYTRKVTLAWCYFFVLNGSIALFTALKQDLNLWTLWNGCLSYICIGLMAAGEYLLRRIIQKRGEI